MLAVVLPSVQDWYLYRIDMQGEQHLTRGGARCVIGRYHGASLALVWINPRHQDLSMNVFSEIGADQVVWIDYCKERGPQQSGGLVIAKAIATTGDQFRRFDGEVSDRLYSHAHSAIGDIDWGTTFAPRAVCGVLVRSGRSFQGPGMGLSEFDCPDKSFSAGLVNLMPPNTGILGVLIADSDGRGRLGLALAAAAVTEAACEEAQASPHVPRQAMALTTDKDPWPYEFE